MPHRHHRIDYIEFTVRDLGATRAFYEQALGWVFTAYGPSYLGIQDGQGGEMGGVQAGEPTEGGPLVVLYSDDLDATLEAVRSAGAEITVEPFAFPGGRRFHFRDPGGNVLAVWTTP